MATTLLRLTWTCCLLTTLLLAACATPEPKLRKTLSLAGTWQLRLDTARAGVHGLWYS